MFTEAGIASVRLNEIVAFTPTAVTLQAVTATLAGADRAGWTRLETNERFYLTDTGWTPTRGLPSRARASAHQVLSKSQDDFVLRLLGDGTSSLLRTRVVGSDDLVATDKPQIIGAAAFVTSALIELENAGSGDGNTSAAPIMDELAEVGLLLDGQPPYPVSEIELESDARLDCLVRGNVDEMQEKLDPLLLYLVARNYRFSDDDGVTLEQLCGEVLPDVLDDGLLLGVIGGRKCLRNLSQGSRVFIAFGRRGTVVAYVNSKAKDSLPIRCSVLSMVETLRSRFQNLLVASSLMDALLLRLAQLIESGARKLTIAQEQQEARNILAQLGTATYIYGLAVTDPGAQLLDGSVLSLMADRAEAYFEIQGLRHACQRKMEAIRTIWASYQDRRRQLLLQALRVTPVHDEGLA